MSNSEADRRDRPVLVTGATGYIGGRLAPRLLDAGWRVRCLVRSERKLRARAWVERPGVEVVEGDVSDEARLAEQMRGCWAAYYLIHAMESAGHEFAERDREMAETFARAAARAGVERIVYLGGLGEMGEDLSEHLRSRREVEEALAIAGVPVTVFRAAMIIGSGSASFEILRYLVERLPVMVTPRWVRTECQPIGVRDVLHFLVRCLDVSETAGRTLDAGGADVVTYEALMRIMAEERGLPRRLIVPVPVLTPRLSSLWIQLITPLSSKIARPLAEGLRNRVVCRDDEAVRLMPQRVLGVREAIRAALEGDGSGAAETAWSDAGGVPGDPDWAGGTTFEDVKRLEVEADAERVFGVLSRIGGTHGYWGSGWLWMVRGALDRVVGGPGLRRGRRDPSHLAYGDAVDFWRVTGIERGRRLALRAEMRLPGVAVLEFEVEPGDAGRCALTQTARFRPRGLLGILYWYSVLPLHAMVFGRMIRGIAREAEERS